jgi:hypothetical protein
MRWRFLAILLLTLVLVVFLSPSLMAQGGEFTGIDIVFIIDQSGSMGGATESRVQANDPLGLRFYATQYAAEWLGSDRLRVHTDAMYRISIIHFGSRTIVQRFPSASGSGHWQVIAPNSPENWEPLRQELRRVLGPEAFGAHLNYTLPLLAFEDAKRLFDELNPDPNRRRVIIVLTDGLPWESDSSTMAFSRQHFGQLQSFVDANFPSPEYTIYTVAMNDSAQSHWTIGEEYWQQITGGRATLVRTNDDVGVLFRRILLEVTSDLPTDVIYTDIEIDPGEVIIPPYLESVEFAFFLSNPTDAPRLSINGADVEPTTASGVTLEGEGTPIQIIRVQDPEPGRWYVDVAPPDTGVNIVMRQIRAQGTLLQPTGTHLQYIPLPIEYRMADSRGNPLRVYTESRYDLKITAEVKSDDDNWQIDLLKQPDNTYQADFTPVRIGPHTIHVHAESEDILGNKIVIYDGPIGTGFTIEPVYFVATSLPSRGQQYESFSIAYEMQDARGQRITDELNLVAEVTITSSTGTDEITIERQENGTYTGTYEPQASGEHVIYSRVQITTEDGQSYALVDEESARFNISPTQLLYVQIVGPEAVEQWDTELFWWVRKPFVLSVEIVDEAGRRVALDEVFVNAPANALQVEVMNEKSESLSDALRLIPSGMGVYSAESTELGVGRYLITVNATGGLKDGLMYGSQTDTLTVTRIRHPHHIPILIGVLVAIIVVVLLFILWQRYLHSLQVHPAVGDLRIVNEYGNPRFRQRLDNFQRNRITFKEKELSETVHVTKLEVSCPTEDAHNNRAVDVKVYLNDEKHPTVERTLRPGSEVKLGQYRLWLLKDPTDEQLEERSV